MSGQGTAAQMAKTTFYDKHLAVSMLMFVLDDVCIYVFYHGEPRKKMKNSSEKRREERRKCCKVDHHIDRSNGGSGGGVD